MAVRPHGEMQGGVEGELGTAFYVSGGAYPRAEGLSSARRGRPSEIYGLTFIKSVVPPRKSPERKEPGEGTRHER